MAFDPDNGRQHARSHTAILINVLAATTLQDAGSDFPHSFLLRKNANRDW